MATKSKKGGSVNTKKSKEVVSKKDGKKKEFPQLFQEFCKETGVEVIPKVRVHYNMSGRQSPWRSTKSSPSPSGAMIAGAGLEMEIVAKYNENGMTSLIFKHMPVSRNMLVALRKSLMAPSAIVQLKLDFCNLLDREIQMLQLILKKNPTITELSANGNPNQYQNHYLLFKGADLKVLSLRFCQINAKGAERIAETLVFEKHLCQVRCLDLSSNFIGDAGAVHLAEALRTNRSLVYLNLADNWIGDVGCRALISVLMKFALKHEEVVMRRHKNMEYLKKRKAVQPKTSYLSVASRQSTGRKHPRSASVKSRLSNMSEASSAKRKFQEQTTSRELDVLMDPHPYMSECYADMDEIYCKGNFTINHLNLAYNKISEIGVQDILNCLRYQRSTIAVVSAGGLFRVVLDGNLVSTSAREALNEIQELLQRRIDRKSLAVGLISTDLRSLGSKRRNSASRINSRTSTITWN